MQISVPRGMSHSAFMDPVVAEKAELSLTPGLCRAVLISSAPFPPTDPSIYEVPPDLHDVVPSACEAPPLAFLFCYGLADIYGYVLSPCKVSGCEKSPPFVPVWKGDAAHVEPGVDAIREDGADRGG